MSTLVKMNEEMARELFEEFAPMFARLEEQGTDYCLVGGLAVVAHCLAQGSNRLRATTDADLMVPESYSNQDFAADYLKVYAANPDVTKAIYEALLGDDGFEQLGEGDAAFVNASFVGADPDIDGADSPDFDVCRILNGRSLGTIKRQRLTIFGNEIWVATIPELLSMKRDTIALYGGDPATYPREQDFIDVRTLESLEGDDAGKESISSKLIGRVSSLLGDSK